MKTHRESVKRQLLDALAAHQGNVEHASVQSAMSQLIALNPTAAPARNEALRDGHWQVLNAPNFPGGESQPDGTMLYCLGRLAFNMFQPLDLKVKLERVSQPILPIQQEPARSHHIVVDFSVHQQPSLKGIVQNLGICRPAGDDTLQVEFTGGTLAPHPDTDLADWLACFGDQSAALSLKQRISQLGMRLMFGIVPPTAMDEETGQVAFTMKRSPKGILTLLYLDEDLRITRGEKGTWLISQRL